MTRNEFEPSRNHPRLSIEELKQRYDTLRTEKIKAETQRESTQKQLNILKAEAKDQFGTDDIGALKIKLAEMVAQNESKRAAYQEDLEKIEQRLDEVEAAIADEPSQDSDESNPNDAF